MTQTEIETLKAGPETDALVGKVIGWVPRKMCCGGRRDVKTWRLCVLHNPGANISVCGRAEKGLVVWDSCKEARIEPTPPFSTDDGVAVGLPLRWLRPYCPQITWNSYGVHVHLSLEFSSLHVSADTLSLAIARAVLLLDETMKGKE